MEKTDTEPLKEYLSVAIAYIIATRERMNRPPFMATLSNIRNVLAKDFDAALAEMESEGLITRRRTLNEDAFEFTPPKRTILKQ
ncbi:MAG: hypothetical protein K1V90_08690 [Muribaculaceae bacterium]